MNSALSAIGWAKQSGKASAATEPTFYQGVTGGKLVDFPIEQKAVEETTGLGAGTGEFRESVIPAADYGVFMRPKAIGSLLQAVLGTVVTTGAGPYTHVITLGASVPYYTLFGKLDTEFRTVADAKLDELSIEWEGNAPVQVNATWVGCTPGWDTAYVPVNDEVLADPFLASGGTFRYDVDGTTLAAAKVLGGKITFKRGVTPDLLSGTVTPDDVNESALEVEVELKIRAASLADMRTILTGASNGTTISDSPIYGSFDAAFALGTNSVTLAATKVPFSCETPEADPKGGPVELTLKGGAYIPSGGTTPITATVINGLASY